ncbi:glycoside hydrolase family 39 [Candidatus Kirkpatrickella diaphorinae]|uniref:Glycoside hydrolase family 39 n=1 Tax=Candidatus Kirkpatrickella diaphorinae TaxID=2984322 RepID=A0ABY6GHK8_9PROT|nr:glycoside hydrolase family 39 [Candidatus Kirkpatrickella diaphorinae]UYH51004.1 glycoside hydrolase family 39 [Candidatus Kirkpatrickella diaphorinae]
MLSIDINFTAQNTSIGRDGQVKDVAGVNGSPISVMPGFPDLEDQFNQMGVTDIRLHDIYGAGDLDNGMIAGRRGNNDQMISNVPTDQADQAKKFIADFGNLRTIFPNAATGMEKGDFDLAIKDANFAITDDYIRRIMNNNASVNPQEIQREILFRVGRTIDGSYELPSNFDIYASLVATLAERYSGNISLSGIPRKIAYWEIWNEPDLTFFWNSNDPARYYEFYTKVARKIREVDPWAKVGGAGVANGYNPGGAYLDGLLSHCKSNNVPLDFISWHYYGNLTSDPQNIIDIGNTIQSSLQQNGFTQAESICSEWNSTPFASKNVFTKVQTARNAAYLTSTFIHMQDCKVDRAYYYRGDALSFGLFNDEPNPADKRYKSFCTYAAQAFALFSQFRQTPVLLRTSYTKNTGISLLAGRDGDKLSILVANYRVDPSLSRPDTAPSIGRLYQQHYVDCGRKIDEVTDDWSVQHYFAGRQPSTLSNNNIVTQHNTVPQLPTNGQLRARTRDYNASSGGITLNIENIPGAVASFEARRIVEGGELGTLLPPITSTPVAWQQNTTYTITDPEAKEDTVTLYTLTLADGTNAPPPVPSPTPTGPSRGSFSVSKKLNNVTLIWFDRIFEGTNIPDDYYVTAGSIYNVTLSLSPKIIYARERTKWPFFASTIGWSFAANFRIMRRSVMGRGHQTATFRLRAMKSGFLKDIGKGTGTTSTMSLGDTDVETVTMQINWQFLSA